MKVNVALRKSENEVIKLEACKGETLYDVLSRNGIELNAPCGGRGKCGKCRVKYRLWGDTKEQDVLACRTAIEGDCEVMLFRTENRILTSGQRTKYDTDGIGDFSLAVDIGTTTIAAYLLDNKSGRQLAAASCLNPQRIHGADVISRIGFSDQSTDNKALLQSEILSMIQEVLKRLLKDAKMPDDSTVSVRSLVGNTAMMHLAGGFNTIGIAKAPYLPEYTALHTQSLRGNDYLMGGCVSGYVGADTLAAMLSCDLDKARDNVLLLDIGTNGEIVLKCGNKYTCCSCAAGPAFEGAHISCGTGAVNGAVDHIKPSENRFSYTTIAGEAASGLCGSGLVDAVAYLLDEERITPVGRMKERFDIAPGVFIDPADIREVQLAKAAISAGIEILTERAGISFSEIDRVLLAGGFGNFIDVHSACKIGLLPKALEEKIETVGNAAGDGAKMLALSVKARERSEALRSVTQYIELSAQDDFEDTYTDNLLFDLD